MIDCEQYELFNADSVDKQWEIPFSGGTITNEELFSESIELEESLCSENSLVIGSCEASVLKFKIGNTLTSLYGQTIQPTVRLDGSEPFALGTYKVYSDKPTSDRKHREIEAYDAMYDIINADVVDWYNSILPNEDSTVFMKSFRTSFVHHFGLEQEDVELANDDMTVERTVDASALSGKDVLTAICEINGCFGHIGRNGKLQYIYLESGIQGLYPRNDLYPADDLYPRDPKSTHIDSGHYITATYEDYVTAGITELVIRQEENDAGITVGSAGNTYIVSGNFLVYGKGADELRQIANNMLSKIKGLEYRPFTADVKGNPCFEVGDAIRFVTTYEFVESYILKRTLKGLQALRDDWSADGVETYTDDTNSVTSQIEQLKGKSNTLERTSEETISELKNLEESTTSRFTQTANSIAAEIERAEGAESTLSGKIETNADAITAEVKRSTGAESDIIATLELKIDKNDDGTIISLINGSADRINFNANNMFTVTAPNLVITADGHLYMTDGTFTGSITGGSITGTTFEQTASGGGVKIKDGQIQSYCNDTNAEAATANIILYNNNSAFSGNERCQISAKAIHFYDADGNSKGKFSINGMVFPDGSVQTKAATTPDLTGYALIDTVTPTSNSTSDTKSPSYSAVAKMIKNIEADIPTVPAAGINVYSSGEGTLTTSGSANYFLCTQTFGQLTSIGAKQLKISGSSKRWKHDIGDISNEELNPHRLYDARIVQFKYNLDYLSSADMRYNMDLPGFIAEELLEIYPVGVDIDEEGLPCDWNARFIIPPMLYLIQEQHGQIEKLEAQVQELINKTENQSREMESLKERIAALEKAMA